MKKGLVLLLVMSIVLVGCGKTAPKESDDKTDNTSQVSKEVQVEAEQQVADAADKKTSSDS